MGNPKPTTAKSARARRDQRAKAMAKQPDPGFSPADPRVHGWTASDWLVNFAMLATSVSGAWLITQKFQRMKPTPSPSPSPSPSAGPGPSPTTSPAPTTSPSPTAAPTPATDEQITQHRIMEVIGIIVLIFAVAITVFKLTSLARMMFIWSAGQTARIGVRTTIFAGTQGVRLASRLMRFLFLPQVILVALFCTFMAYTYYNWDNTPFTQDGLRYGDVFLFNSVMFVMVGLLMINIAPAMRLVPLTLAIIAILFLYNVLFVGLFTKEIVNPIASMISLGFVTFILLMLASRSALMAIPAVYTALGVIGIAFSVAFIFGYNAFAIQEKTDLPLLPAP